MMRKLCLVIIILIVSFSSVYAQQLFLRKDKYFTEVYLKLDKANIKGIEKGTVPKHAEMSDYRAASGLEALLGYLFLSGEDGRIRELMDNIKQSLFTEDKEK